MPADLPNSLGWTDSVGKALSEQAREQLLSGAGTHPLELLVGFLAALTVPFLPPGHSASG